MARRNFSRSDYRGAITDYQNNWELLDDVLRKLCEDHPNHGERAAINAKVQIIGLSYGTGIQRLIAPRGKGPGQALYQVAEHLFNYRDDVDRLVAAICAISEPLTFQDLLCIVETHGCFVKLLRQITRPRPNAKTETSSAARSFASKYLHFHKPIVPIYDSVAAEVLPRLMPLSRAKQHLEVPLLEHADPLYYDYALRFFALYSEIRSACLPVSVKYVDAYLLWLASLEPQGDELQL